MDMSIVACAFGDQRLVALRCHPPCVLRWTKDLFASASASQLLELQAFTSIVGFFFLQELLASNSRPLIWKAGPIAVELSP